MNKKYKIEGMSCASCAKMIELDLEDEGIESSCDYSQGILEIKNKTNQEDKIKRILNKSGYKIKPLK